MSERTRGATVLAPAESDGLHGVTRGLALLGGLALTASYVSVLHDVTAVVGGTTALAAVVAGSVVLATVLALAVRPRVAALLAAVLLGAGAVAYMEAAPLGWRLLDHVGKVALDAVALSTGISVLRMQAVGAWALGFAPAPVFLSWYLFVRRRYAAGVAVGGLALLWFVLTGDAGATVTLLGVVGGAATLGFGEIDWRGRSAADVEMLVVVLSAMVVVTTTTSVVPAGSPGSPFFPGGSGTTVEASLVGAGERLGIVGSVSLSPKVRFVVESNRQAYWRVGAYNRYTGQGWVRTGRPSAFDEDALATGGRGQRIVQTVSIRTRMQAIPAAWRPASLRGDAREVARLSSLGGLQASGALTAGDEYTVVSYRRSPPENALRAASDDYPDRIEDRYTQLPASMPDRLDTFTDRLTDGAAGAYESARRIESWLETNKRYSLDVSRPEGDVASSFVFDMDAGYCTYFATAMVAMLRTQDVPARMAVGYTPGQQVAEDRWVVRGYNAHAWVEVFFPELGWVKFDPTPASQRRSAERERLQQARRNGVDGVDTEESEEGTWTPTPTPSPTPGRNPDETPTTPTPTPDGNGSTPRRTPGGGDVAVGAITPTGSSGGPGAPRLPSGELVALGLVVVAGVAAGVRRSGAVPRLRRFAGTYWQRPTGDPERDVRRAVERLERSLAREHRRRRPSESHNAYLSTVANLDGDDRLRRVGRIHERAVYAGGVDATTARDAIELVDEVVRDRAPLLARWRS